MSKSDARRFLAPLFASIPEHLDVLLWILNPADSNDHSSFFLQDLDQTLALLKKFAQWHIYYGVGLREHQGQPRPRWRGGSADIRALWALHGDIDIAHPLAHKNTQLPPDEATARKIIETVALPPSFLVHSGFGLQPIWAFKEPEVLETPEDRFVAQDVARRLHAVLATEAQRLGRYTVDATHDLARVLRLPGSINHKIPEDPHPCCILETGPFYAGLGDFLDLLPPLQLGISQEELEQSHGKTAGLTLESGKVDPDDFTRLWENAKFRQTWEKRRRDFGDGSQSAYDFSIALQALYTGWSPQDTLALMYAFRKKYRNDHRLAYYLFTLNKAIATVATRQGEPEALESYLSERETLRAQEEHENERVRDAEDSSALFEEFGNFLGIANGSVYTQECRGTGITWLKHGEKRVYNLIFATPDGTQQVRLSEKQIFDAREVRMRCGPILQYIDSTPLRTAQKTWIRLLNRLFAIMTEEVQEELIFADRLKSILLASLRHCAVYSQADACQQAVDGGHAFVFEGEYYTPFDRLRERVQETDPEWTRLDLSMELRKLPNTRNINKRGTTRRARYWIIPLTSFDSETQDEAHTEKEDGETYH